MSRIRKLTHIPSKLTEEHFDATASQSRHLINPRDQRLKRVQALRDLTIQSGNRMIQRGDQGEQFLQQNQMVHLELALQGSDQLLPFFP